MLVAVYESRHNQTPCPVTASHSPNRDLHGLLKILCLVARKAEASAGPKNADDKALEGHF